MKIYWKVTLGHRLDNNFWTLQNPLTQFFESRLFELEFQQKFSIFSIEILRVIVIWILPQRATCNSDSNYVLIKGRKNGSLTFFFSNLVLKYYSYALRTVHQKSNFGKRICEWLVIHKTKLLWKFIEKWTLVTV